VDASLTLAVAGALAGTAVGEAVAAAVEVEGAGPVAARLRAGVVGGTGELASWRFGPRTAAALESPVDELVAGLGPASGVDPACVLADAVEHGPGGGADLAEVGRRLGAAVGIGGLPSRWTTYLRGTVDGREVGTEDLVAHAARATGVPWPTFDPGPEALGPTRLPEGIWVANHQGALTAPAELAVVSLCPVGTGMDGHRARRTVLLTDLGPEWNPAAPAMVLDAIDAIDAFRAEGREVLVHCAYGHSRTGLVLRAWLARHHGLDPEAATALAQDRWPWVHTRNAFFTEVLGVLYADGRLRAD
jgi:ADP-ribosyl-[dinitrogen reductase] hydrolase